jgi:hypothetical protein
MQHFLWNLFIFVKIRFTFQTQFASQLNCFTFSNIVLSIYILELTQFFPFKSHNFCFARGYFEVVVFVPLVFIYTQISVVCFQSLVKLLGHLQRVMC